MKKLTLIIAILLSGQITAETIIVDQGGTGSYKTIVEGINASSSGDTVFVLPGVYVEAIHLNKSIVVKGSGAEVTTIYYANVAVYITGESAELIGFSVQSTQATTISMSNGKVRNCIVKGNPSDEQYPAINVTGKVEILNTVIKDSKLGIVSISSGDAVITNCIFYNNSTATRVGKDGAYDGTMTIQNSIYHSNTTATAKYRSDRGYLTTLYCAITSSKYGSYTTSGLGDIIDEPKFEDIDKSFALKSDSPARDAGNPSSGYNDGDGSRNDMGVYGGPYSWGKGPVITDIAVTPATINQGGSVTITATAKKN